MRCTRSPPESLPTYAERIASIKERMAVWGQIPRPFDIRYVDDPPWQSRLAGPQVENVLWMQTSLVHTSRSPEARTGPRTGLRKGPHVTPTQASRLIKRVPSFIFIIIPSPYASITIFGAGLAPAAS